MDCEEVCPLSQKQIESEDKVVVAKKGADSINKASIKRGVCITVLPGTVVHKSCRVEYIHERLIKAHEKSKFATAAPVKRSRRISGEHFDIKSDCIFCGNKVCTDRVSFAYSDYSLVKTFGFVNKIFDHCQK